MNNKRKTESEIEEQISKLNLLITEAYSRDLQKPELVSFKEVSSWGRKFGFPLVCSLADKSEAEKIHWAASLLVEVARSWPREDMPELLTPELGSALAYDAKRLIEHTLSNFGIYISRMQR